MLRKKYYIATGVRIRNSINTYTVKFKRTKPGDFKCPCILGIDCHNWTLANHRFSTNICITSPRTGYTAYTRHYYYADAIKKM